MTATEQRKKKAQQMAAYYSSKGDSTSAGAKAASRAVAKAEGSAQRSDQSAAVSKYRAGKATVQDIYNNRSTRSVPFTTQEPNPALAQRITNTVLGTDTPRRSVIAYGGKGDGRAPEIVTAAQKEDLRNKYGSAVGVTRDAAKTGNALLHNPVMWASDTFGSAVDSAASGVASAAATGMGFVNEQLAKREGESALDEEGLERGKSWEANLRSAANANAESAAKYRQSAVETAGNTKFGEFVTDLGVAGAQMYIDALTGAGLGTGSMAPMLARSFGYGAQEAADKGMGATGQILYGVKSAGVEYLSEKLFGGNPAYDSDAGIVNKLIDKAVGTENSALIRALSSKPADIVYEGLEEVVSGLLNPLIEQGAVWVTGDERIEVDWPKAEELLRDFAIGSAMSAASNLGANMNKNAVSIDEYAQLKSEYARRAAAYQNQLAKTDLSNPAAAQKIRNEAAWLSSAEAKLSEMEARQNALAQQAAQEAAQQASVQTEAGMAPEAENASSGVLNTAQDAQNEAQRTTTADIYANRGTKGADAESGVKVSAGPSALAGSKGLGNTLASNIESIRGMEPVHTITGDELNNRARSVSDQIRDFFKSLGNKVTRPNFGDVELSEYGVASTINHLPINRARVLSVAAAPDVIANGQLIEYNENWKGRGYNSYVFAAPVTIGNDVVYVAAVVTQTDRNKFYLSEMVDSNGNYVRIEKPHSAAQRAGVTVQDGVTAGPSGASTDTRVSNDTITRDAESVNPDGRDMGEDSLFDATRGPGAGAVREGPQVPSQNNLTKDANLSDEARQHIADSTPTHEQISDTLANTRAEAQIIRDADGNWVNLQDSMDDLRQSVAEHGVLTPEQDKLAAKVAHELDRRARESGDFSELRAFNQDVISRTKTNSAQSLHAWREFSGSSTDVTTTALSILDNAPLRKGVDVNEVATRVSAYSDRAQQLFGADDISGLQALVTEISTERGYKPSRSIQKIINEQANAEQLYSMAQQLSVALAVDQIKPGIGQKLATWQTLSHLLNSRTIIRNVVSNTLFSPVDRIANNIGILPDFVFAMVRSATGKGSVQQNRTVGYQPNLFAPTKGGKQVRQTRKEYIQQARLKNALDINLDSERSKNPNKSDRAVNRTFKRKGTDGESWVNKAWNRYNNVREGLLGYGLNVTDAWQKGKTKGQSEVAMNRLMNRDGSIVSEAAAERITNDDMLYRSFQRDTALGDLLGGLREFANRAGVGKRVGKGGKSHEYGLGSMLSAYTQVPGALVHTEADYTPLGVLNTAGELVNAIRYGSAEADAVVKGGKYDGMTNADASVAAQHNAAVSLARAGIGGGVMALFGWLARAGIVAFQPYGGDDKDKDETNAAQGKGGLQFNQSAFVRALRGEDPTWQNGDVIHDISQYPPLSTIAEIGVILADEDDDNKFVSILTATARGIAEQFGDLSMMNTVRTIYDDIQYAGDKDAVEVAGDIAGDIAADSISGLVPGTIRQAAKVSDGTMRDTSADTVGERIWNRFRSVMPGLRQTLPAKVDYKGEEREYAGNGLTRALNTFVLPGDVTVYQQDDVVDYIDRIGEGSGRSLYAAAYAPKSLEADGEKYALTADDRRAYNEAYKSAYYSALGGLMNASYADKLTDDMASEVAAELRSLAADSAKRAYFEAHGIEYSSDYDKYQQISDPALYMTMKESLKQLEKSGGTDSAAFDAAYSQWKGLSQKEKEKYTEGIEGEFNGIDTLKRLDACLRGGMSTEQFYKAKDKYTEIGKLDDLSASDKRAQFANWLDTKSGFKTAQKRTALSSFTFYSNIPADDSGYEKLTEAGVDAGGSKAVYNTIRALEPAEGYTEVALWQKCEAITQSDLSEEEKLEALSVYASDSGYEYYEAAYNNGVSLDRWSQVQSTIRSYEGDIDRDGKSNGGTISQSNLIRAMYACGMGRRSMEAMFNEYRAAKHWTATFDKAFNNVDWSWWGY